MWNLQKNGRKKQLIFNKEQKSTEWVENMEYIKR